jgi:primosomal protein N' (replication factor Y) (superfamily II helicase)
MSERARVCRVQPDVPAVRRAFDYTLPDALAGAVRVGTIVRVPLHGRRVRGWVLDADVSPGADGIRLREVHAVVSAGPPPDVVELCAWAAWRWAGPRATFLRAASPPNVVPAGPGPEQAAAVYPTAPDAPTGPLVLVAPGGDDAALVVQLVAPEGSTIVLDPDAARAARAVALLARQGREVVSVRSDRGDAELATGWDRARSGACVVVGGRTAIWSPVPDLARVVVVDEADEALEDERAPTWNARDVAFERVRRAHATVRVVTPAPTVDALVALGDPTPATERVPWPRAVLVDTRDEPPGHALLSGALADELRRVRDAGRRSVCVLNRRGRARLLACGTCAELARCENCGATVEERDGALACPRCDQIRPLVCLHCHGTRFRALRPGVNRVRDDLAALLPRASVAAVDASTGSLPAADVLIGTEAVLHRAPRDGTVRLVAFLELDQELLAPRARAAEQALWLLVRAARLLGPRAGGGLLLLQTRLPDHEVVAAAREGAPLLVADAERSRRRILGWPPFGGVAELAGAPDAVAAMSDALRAVGTVAVLGPADAGARALVRAASVRELCDALARPEVDAAHASGRLRVDVDPRRA